MEEKSVFTSVPEQCRDTANGGNILDKNFYNLLDEAVMFSLEFMIKQPARSLINYPRHSFEKFCSFAKTFWVIPLYGFKLYDISYARYYFDNYRIAGLFF